MYSEDGNRMCVGRDCERRRKGKFAQVRWKKNPAYVCECYNGRSISVVTVVQLVL